MDLWYGFACFGMDLLKNAGVLTLIAQNNWTTSTGAKKMRNKIICYGQFLQMLDFNDYMVFEDSASIQTMVMIFVKNDRINNYQFDARKLLPNAKKCDMLDLFAKKQTEKTKYSVPTVIRENYVDKLLTFNQNDDILNKLAKGKFYLQEDEIAQGIVFPQDFLNRKGQKILGSFNIGDGIFGLSNTEKENLHLTDNEKCLIKPYFTTEQIHKYYTEKYNTLWLIYTDSSFKKPNSMDNYPNLKRHLDKFVSIFTSDNKPYGLHRARVEHFFKGKKIIVQRKCPDKPIFSYSDFDCYVTQTFFIIQTERWNMKFLTGLLNSTLVAFWLKNKGKMQGENYQVDKEPLMNIPIPAATNVQQYPIINLVEDIISSKDNDTTLSTSKKEHEIDTLVYNLYGLTDEEIKIMENE